MPYWLLIHGRERALYVRGAESGAPLFTRQTELALRFDSADKARKWIASNTVTAFGELALLREIPSKKNAAAAGRPGGVNSSTSKEYRDVDFAIPESEPQAS
ncbi:MAG: hypothetical protein WBO04_12105 [Steroidobacteraceae bacterium]